MSRCHISGIQIWNAVLGGGISVTKLIGAVNVLYAVVYLARRHGAPRFFAAPQAKWMLLLTTLAIYSFLTNERAELSLLNPVAMYTSALLLFFVTLSVIDSVQRLYWSLMVAVGAVAFATIYLLREWRRGVEVWGGGFRPGWVLGDSNYFAVAALAVLPISFELLLYSRKRWEKIYCLGCMLLIFVTLTIGASRGGFLGIATATVYLVLRHGLSKKYLIRILFVAVPLLLFASNSPVHRFLFPAPGDTQSVEKHLLGWRAGLNMVAAHPLLGVGLGNYKAVVVSYDKTGLVAADPHIAHNAYLEIAAEMGIPALLVYLAFLTTTFRSLEKTRKQARARDSKPLAAIALGMQASLLAVCVAIFFVSGQYTRMFWLVLIMTMVMPSLVPKRKILHRDLEIESIPVEQPALQVGPALIEMQ